MEIHARKDCFYIESGAKVYTAVGCYIGLSVDLGKKHLMELPGGGGGGGGSIMWYR